MENQINDSIIDTLYEEHNQKFTHHIIKTSKEYRSKRCEIEERLNKILKFVPKEHYDKCKKEIDDTLWIIVGFSEFWNKPMYKLGLIDGFKLGDEIKKEVEESKKWKN